MNWTIERVAQAICDECNGVGDWSSLVDHDKELFRFQARAAVGALRKPSPGMIAAMIENNNGPVVGGGRYFDIARDENAANCWNWLVDRILQDEPEQSR